MKTRVASTRVEHRLVWLHCLCYASFLSQHRGTKHPSTRTPTTTVYTRAHTHAYTHIHKYTITDRRKYGLSSVVLYVIDNVYQSTNTEMRCSFFFDMHSYQHISYYHRTLHSPCICITRFYSYNFQMKVHAIPHFVGQMRNGSSKSPSNSKRNWRHLLRLRYPCRL